MAEARTPQDPQFVGRNVDLVHHERKVREVKSADMQVNLTSMIDVIFLLLIYFVVTASFAVGEGVIVAKMPEGSGPSDALAPKKQKLIVEISSAGSDPTGYMINIQGVGRPQNFAELAAMLAEIQGDVRSASDPVVIQPDPLVRWQHAVDAFNAAIKARYTDVRFGQSR